MPTWTIMDPEAGWQPITQVSTALQHPIGTIVRAYDSTSYTATAAQGAGEFIYLQGVGSTVAGSLVTYNAASGVTVLAPTTASTTTPFAVAMAATVASTFGWYQISGNALIAKTTIKVSPAVSIYVTGSGLITSTASTGKKILNAVSANVATVASATGTVMVTIQRPGGSGGVTA